MRRANVDTDNFLWTALPELTVAKLTVAAILLTAFLSVRSMAQQPGQKTFSSPEDASTALVAAAQSNDEKAMLDILGPDGKQIVSSGDDTEDANLSLIHI